jgi:hypothetical protein
LRPRIGVVLIVVSSIRLVAAVFDVSMIGVCEVTVTVSATADGRISILTRTDCPIVAGTRSWATVANPGNVKVTV